MGIQLIKAAVTEFSHLPETQYKALIWMCYRALDAPNEKDGVPRALWFAKWTELANAMNRPIPKDLRHRQMLRRDVSKVCRKLVAAGAIEWRPHPSGSDDAAYSLILDPTAACAPVDKPTRQKAEGVQNPLWGEVESTSGGEVESTSGGEVESTSGGEVESTSPLINRNEDVVEEGVEEGVKEKGEDNPDRRGQPPASRRPVDNREPIGPATAARGWGTTLDKVRANMAGAVDRDLAAAAARHARRIPVAKPDPDRE